MLPGAAGPGVLLSGLVFALWWHRPAMVDPVPAVVTVGVHTATTVFLLRGARRVGDPALVPLVITIQVLAAIGFVLRMRVGVETLGSLAAYLTAVGAGAALFSLGRSLAAADRLPEGPARNRRIQRTNVVLLALTVGSCALALASPVDRGAQIGLSLGPLHIQPTEVFRFCLLGWIAFRLRAPSDVPRLWGAHRSSRAVWMLAEYALVPAVLATLIFVKLSDLGPAVVLFIGIVGVVVHVTSRWRYAAMATVGFLLLAVLAMIVHLGVLGERLALWKDPFYRGGHGAGATLHQPGMALLAYARGGVLGAGPGLGRVDSIGLERRNDFILAVLGEEFGLIGTLLTGALYVLLLVQLFRLARRAGEESWLRAWLVGLSVMLAANIAWPALATTRVLPISGITTPLLSAGGTSMLVVLGIVGLAAGCAGPRPAATASFPVHTAPVVPAAPAASPAGRRPSRSWRAPALAGLLAAVAALSLLHAQLLAAGPRLDRYDPGGGIVRTERATFDRGRILTADGQVLAATDWSGQLPARRRSSAGPPVGEFRPSSGSTSASGLEYAWSMQLECGSPPGEDRSGPHGALGRRCRPADLRTSYDTRIQEAAVRALREARDAAPGARGAVVALDPRTGGVLAIADDDDLATSPGTPIQPGSVFKMVTTAAIDPARLGGYHLVPHSDVPLPDGRSLRNFGHGTCPATTLAGIPALVDALRESCNTAFALVGKDLGAERIAHAAAALGFGTPGSAPAGRSACAALGLAPRGDDFCDLDGLPLAVSSIGSRTADGRPCLVEQLALGQACVSATPLQMALVGAAVAEGGELRPPHTVAQVERDGAVLWRAPAARPRPAIPAENAAVIRDGMVAAVQAGTATRAAVPCAQVAAKTGTPEVGADPANLDNDAWTVAFAPARDPVVVVAVYLKAPPGGDLTGGGNAAPPAATVLRTALVALGTADHC